MSRSPIPSLAIPPGMKAPRRITEDERESALIAVSSSFYARSSQVIYGGKNRIYSRPRAALALLLRRMAGATWEDVAMTLRMSRQGAYQLASRYAKRSDHTDSSFGKNYREAERRYRHRIASISAGVDDG